MFDQPKCKFFHIQDIIFDRTDTGQPDSHLLILKFRPENSRCVQKLYIFVQADPLFSLGHTRSVYGLCTCFSRKCINKRRFSNIRNSSHHCTDWTVFNSTAAVTFNFFLAGLLYNILNGLHPRSISGIHFYNMKTFLLKIFFPCFILSFICQICFVQKNQS